MKNLIHQFYNEGFATTFYQKPIRFLKKRIKNKNLYNVISIIIKIIYTLLIIAIALLIFYKQFPL